VGGDSGRRASSLPTGTVTFLFTDIEGSTRLLQALGDEYPGALETHGRLIRRAVADHGGTVIATEGDSVFAVFHSAVTAVAATAQAQRALAAAEWPAGLPIRVRMGLHTGEGRVTGGDYVGLDVHRAARISAAAHGGEVLVSDSTRALTAGSLPEGVTLRDLGAHRLKDLEVPERMHRLVIDGLPSEFPPPRSIEIGKAHVPPRPTTFIGRRAELDALRELVRSHHLVTLVGPGGTGKTRLSMELAEEAAGDFDDGAWFVDLAPLSDPALVEPTIARCLGLSDQPGQSMVELLRTYLEPKDLLLVLDNFEHLLPATPVVEQLLATARGLRVVVTSRSVLHLYGEQEFPVAPLGLPEAGAATSVDELTKSEAVRLFVERARAVKPTFSVTPESGRAVTGICIRVDGLPLAIELAASRVRLLEPMEILARLDRHLPVLALGASNLPARQRTLRATIDWSYDLLPASERALFVRLAIFAGGCSLDAAEPICNPGSELGIDTLDGIGALVDQSLVRHTSVGAESRFSMLETIREYGRDRLTADGALDEVGRRHLHHYRDLAEAAELNLIGADQATWLDRVEREHDNIREALRRALDLPDADAGLRLAAALWRFWFQRGYLREGRSWLEAVLAVEPDAISSARAKAYGALGGLSYWLSDVESTERAYGEAVRLYQEMGDRFNEAEARYNLAFVAVMRRDMTGAIERFGDSLALAEQVGRPDVAAKSRQALGMSAIASGDPERALTPLEEGLAFFREAGEQFHIGDALTGLAQARTLLGHHQHGRLAYLEAVRIFMAAHNLPGIGTVLSGMGGLESSAGRYVDALRLLGAADALRDRTGATAPLMPVVVAGAQDAAVRALGEEAAEAALAAGRMLTLEEAVELVEALTADPGS
jgi:predicted ATPase/class 3 adenylate cyclase